MLKIFMQYRKETLIIELKGNLDKNTAYKLSEYLVAVILKYHIKKIIINFEKVNNIDEFGESTLKIIKHAAKNNLGKVLYINKKVEGWYE